ncbi:ArsR/SmtB family transcription factor [Caldanaerobius polysaccharolyticus]|uniref:ArsR/SmtB family transcription factor n=1 Tax=Caldanaerobius polysaccharolyticus TaxID=44256 RepID=UPI00047AACCD|nr:metalloregulator ArsR/SmtB family transcription factor [Caldanaerobius polysaccharolyticus]
MPDIKELKVRLFKGFSDSTRLSIIEALKKREKTVSELVAEIGGTQSNISGHLRCLKDWGILESRQEGRNIYYYIHDKRILDILKSADMVIANFMESLYKKSKAQPV